VLPSKRTLRKPDWPILVVVTQQENQMPISSTAAEGNVVSLLNCADEPIHIPGYIQPHGALLVFEEGRLIGMSGNATDFLHLNQGIGAPAELLNLDQGANRRLIISVR
jgi:hypothetical protein